MRSFQFKILHRIIYFNDKLYLFRLVNNSECDFCKEYIDSIEHRFWQCRISQCLWNNVIQWHNNLTNEYVNLNYLQLVSNICNSELLDFDGVVYQILHIQMLPFQNKTLHTKFDKRNKIS